LDYHWLCHFAPFLNYIFLFILELNKHFKLKINIKCQKMGIGDWGLGIGDWGLGPIPKTPNPKPQTQ